MRNTFLDYIRHALALTVILSHSFPLAGSAEPRILGVTPGTLAVYGFFLLSGHLITQSWRRDPRVLPFVIRRAARILPAWLAALVLGTALAALCAGFHDNPYANVVNGSLWTLPWEGFCYCLVILTRGRVMAVVPLVAILVALGAPPVVPSLIAAFALGSLIPSLRWGVCHTPLQLPALPADLSYGLYVYAFPVQQALVYLLRPSPMALAALALACLVPLCLLSWHLLEQPLLRFAAQSTRSSHSR